MASRDRKIINRLPHDFRVDFIHAGDYMISCSQDVSMDGMFINTNSSPPVGSLVNLIFPAEDHLDVEVSALVVWNRKQSSYQKPGMGVQFLSPLPQTVKNNFLKDIDRIVILSERGISA